MLKKIFLVILASLILLPGAVFSEDVIKTESTNTSTSTSTLDSSTKLTSPPPSAIAPSLSNSASDSCLIALSAGLQTQVLGISGGSSRIDYHCRMHKDSKLLRDLGLKVGSVARLCQDEKIFTSLWQAGSYCPYEGLVGSMAKEAWLANPDKIPGATTGKKEEWSDEKKSTATGLGAVGGMLLALLFIF